MGAFAFGAVLGIGAAAIFFWLHRVKIADTDSLGQSDSVTASTGLTTGVAASPVGSTGSDSSGGGGGGGCFVAGTLVDTPGGPVPIESIKLRDRVSSFKANDPTKDLEHTVAGLSTFLRGNLVTIKLDGGEICCTPRQLFLANGKWILASKLSAGDKVSSRSGSVVEVTAVRQGRDNVPVFHVMFEEASGYYISYRRGNKHPRPRDDNSLLTLKN
jgi:hypothetical protein